MVNNSVRAADSESACYETREALRALDQLLTGQASGEMIDCQRVGVLMRMVAERAACAVDLTIP